MENETLKRIINQIKKYELTETFSDIEQFKDWISKLNSTQINNFLSLDIDLEEIKNLKHLLINTDLLNCEDYKKRVYAISKLKNGEGCWHLFDALCKPNFLKSKNFYKDIEMLSKADTARYGLWVLGKDVFINSPYHDEDLRLIVETHDTKEEEPLDFVVSDALATVAGNINSIKSPYHQKDMELISKVGSDCLQMGGSYPESSPNKLAVNKVSLEDRYHLENMQILATHPIASEFLYVVMTNPKFVKGKYYRKEVETLANAKSKLAARALYYYIVNPERKFKSDFDFYDDYELNLEDVDFYNPNYISGNEDPDYVSNLERISKIDDKFVMHYVSLLMNPDFVNSPYKKFDLELLQTISIKPIFMDLYRLMSDEVSLNSAHHRKDAVIISQVTSDGVRDLLLEKATDVDSHKSNNHEYDMEYISRLDLDSISEKIYDAMYYYLFNEKGIADSGHVEKLEKLLEGELVERSDSLSSYLESLEEEIEKGSSDEAQIIDSVPGNDCKKKSKVLGLLKKYIGERR